MYGVGIQVPAHPTAFQLLHVEFWQGVVECSSPVVRPEVSATSCWSGHGNAGRLTVDGLRVRGRARGVGEREGTES